MILIIKKDGEKEILLPNNQIIPYDDKYLILNKNCFIYYSNKPERKDKRP